MLERTLDELDPPAWGEPAFSSNLVKTCHALRSKPLGDFDAGDLRIMIGQNIGLAWLVPLALDVLEREPWVGGTYYEGDLLSAVCGIGEEFWRANRDLAETAAAIVAKDLEQHPEADANALADVAILRATLKSLL